MYVLVCNYLVSCYNRRTCNFKEFSNCKLQYAFKTTAKFKNKKKHLLCINK